MRRWLTALCLCLASSFCLAQTIPVQDASTLLQTGTLPLNPDLQYTRMPAGSSIADVLGLASDAWLPSNGNRNYGYQADAFWFRARLSGMVDIAEGALLRLNLPHHDTIRVALVADGKPLRQFTVGDALPFAARPFLETVFLFPLDAVQSASVDVYIGIETTGAIITPVDLMTRQAFDQDDKRDVMALAAFYGVMTVMFLYNLIIYLVVRDRAYLYYLAYLVSLVFMLSVMKGVAFRYLWPDMPLINAYSVIFATCLMPMAAVLFARRFLNLAVSGSSFDNRLVNVLVAIYALLMVAGLFLPYALVVRTGLFFSTLAVFLGFYLGIKYSLRGIRAARIFASAWFVYLLFLSLFILESAGLIQPSLLTRYAVEIGSALEVVLLSLGFADRLNQEKQQRLRAQSQALQVHRSLNEELESMVQARTEELEEANRQLKRLSISDGLTGVYNRRHFDEQLEIEYQRALRNGDSLCLLLIDADHFKKINDTYGHGFGDECLKAMALTLDQCAHRPTDIVARYGGEEFVVLLPGVNLPGGKIVAENIRSQIESLSLNSQGHAVAITVSIGLIACSPHCLHDKHELLAIADDNLYAAKAAGRNEVKASGGVPSRALVRPR
ncbi:sensor domain-containing diguanylate cyclase [Marinobacter fonticola]|uniref:sensor domain-containing diguanylate cyclase n=1 Tax=Marinobacter fonticola TaxID=2603215 RepID=UPI0011E77428|nr:diguanylate cyclase [Marinobacter fonticola]